MASPPNLELSPGIPSGLTDFFLLIADNRFLLMFILILKGLAESVDWICGLFHS
jgi:hypothetical protein